MSSLLIHTGSRPTQRISDAGAALGSEIQGNFSFVDTKVKSLILGGAQPAAKRLFGVRRVHFALRKIRGDSNGGFESRR